MLVKNILGAKEIEAKSILSDIRKHSGGSPTRRMLSLLTHCPEMMSVSFAETVAAIIVGIQGYR